MPIEKVSQIYGLRDPRTGEYRYVGIAKNPKQRLKNHLSDARSANTARLSWLRDLIDSGLIPELIILDDVYGEPIPGTNVWHPSSENDQDKERYWMGKLHAEGNRLTNHPSHVQNGLKIYTTSGGDFSVPWYGT